MRVKKRGVALKYLEPATSLMVLVGSERPAMKRSMIRRRLLFQRESSGLDDIYELSISKVVREGYVVAFSVNQVEEEVAYRQFIDVAHVDHS